MSSFINFFLLLQSNLRLYHWQTKSYPRHKATDELVDSIVELADEFMESYIGRHDRPKMEKNDLVLKMKTHTDESIVKYLKECITYLTDHLPKKLKDDEVDLLNVRDEMVAKLTKTLYLYTLS